MRISDWSSDVCSSDLKAFLDLHVVRLPGRKLLEVLQAGFSVADAEGCGGEHVEIAGVIRDLAALRRAEGAIGLLRIAQIAHGKTEGEAGLLVLRILDGVAAAMLARLLEL